MRLSEEDFRRLVERNPSLAKYCDPKPNITKYRNVKVYEFEDGFVSPDKTVQNHGSLKFVYDSGKEYERWFELKILERAGKIQNLERQKVLLIQDGFTYNGNEKPLKVNKIVYKADFFYIENGVTVVEDVKPFDDITQEYRLTWKLLMYKYPNYKFKII